MTPYKNLEGSSGVAGYGIGRDYIDVEFTSGDIYRYTSASAGRTHLATMKKLARAGQGLSTFISQTVREGYETKRTG